MDRHWASTRAAKLADTFRSATPRTKLAGGAAAIIAVALLTLTVAVGRNAPSRGGNTPSDVAATLVTALEQRDLVTLAQLIAPAERRSYIDAFETARDNWDGQRSDTRTLTVAELADLEIDVELTTEIEPVDAQLANIYLDGTITVQTPPALQRDEGDTSRRINVKRMRLTTIVAADQLWYISPAATLSEALRARYTSTGNAAEALPLAAPASSDTPGTTTPGDPTAGGTLPPGAVTARGATQPERIVVAFLAAISAEDLRSVIATFNPDEMGPLQQRAGSWIDAAQTDLESRGAWNLSGITTSVTMHSDTHASVTIDSLTITYNTDGTERVVSVDTNDCYRTERQGANPGDGALSETFCANDILADANARDTSVELIGALIGKPGRTIDVRRIDGQWYVNPAATVANLIGMIYTNADDTMLAGLGR